MEKVFIMTFCSLISIIYLTQAISQVLPEGLPEDINGYTKWTKLNKRIIKPRSADPHRGFKRIYINQEKNKISDSNKNLIFPYPEGTIIVKEVRQTRRPKSNIVLVSIMRKLPRNETTGGWDFIEYVKAADGSFSPLNFPKESCFSCHQGASNSDSVWTRFDNF